MAIPTADIIRGQALGQRYVNVILAERFRTEFLMPVSAKMFEMITERWPYQVYYIDSKTSYVAPDSFLLRMPSGPSDCVWIVPGTLN